ncbi:MAG: peptidoglycan DD-metalloendopeptidase family protein [Burkholderiaceae bacterium]
MLAGCASPRRPAPVEDRTATPLQSMPAATAPSAAVASMPAPLPDAVKLLPGAENAGKPGYYSVKPGDTLIRVALENGQNWKDLVRWNGLENPNVIEVGQVLRVVAPGLDAASVATRGVTTARVETRPLEPRTAAMMASTASAPIGTVPPAVAPAPAPAVATPLPREGADDDIAWAWPASGSVAGQFEDGKSKGLAIAGRAGDPVVAAADGKVVYAGSGLRGYGNLVILKHNNTYLTAYAHNQTLLVKEDQSVKRGQKIAEMGSTDAERVQLHFEIRRLGKPIDPTRLLPAR